MVNLGAAWGLWLALTPVVWAGPQFAVDKASLDLGVVWIGSEVRKPLRISNPGDAELVIQSAVGGEKLDVRGVFPLRIAPGGNGEVLVSVRDTQNRGRFSEAVRFSANTAQPASVTVTGEVKWYLEPSTPSPQLGRVAPGDVGQATVTIFNRGPDPLTVTLANPQHGPFRATLIESRAGREFKLLIDLLAPAQPGAQRGDFVLRSNAPTQPELHIHPIASVPKSVDVSPTNIILDQRLSLAEALREPTEHDVTVRIYGPREGRVTRATIDDPRAAVELRESVPGRVYRAVVKLPGGFQPSGPVTLRLETDHPDRGVAVVGLVTKESARQWRPANSLKSSHVPEFDLQTSQGRLASADLARNPATVLNFVAPDCGFCTRQLPDVDRARQEFEAHGVRFIAVSQRMFKDFSDSDALQHYGEIAPELEVLLNHTNTLGEQFLVTSYPSLFILDADGTVRSVVLGAQQNMYDLLKGELNAILAH